MNRKRLQQVILGSAGAVVLAGGALLAAAEYQAGHQFAPTESDRALNVNQVVFPEQENQSNSGDRSQDDNSELWEKDHNANDAEHPQDNGNADYLFENRQTLSDSAGQTAGVDGGPNATTTGGADVIYDFTGDASRADVILDRGSGAATDGGSGTGEADDDRTPVTPATTPNPGSNGGVTPQPTPRPGGVAIKDPENTKNTPAPDPMMPSHSYDESVKPSLDGLTYHVYIGIASSYENMLYIGQEVDARTIYNSLDTYVMTENFDRYIWGSEDYNKYVRVDAVSFDGGETWITDFPVVIPDNIPDNNLLIRVSYRLSTSDDWTTEDVEYTVSESRILVLNTPLDKNSDRIDPDTIISGDFDQYSHIGDKVNLLGYQNKMLPEDEPLTQLFTGWTEDGKQVPWFYPVTGGRHILEPTEMVDFDSDACTVQLELYWMTDAYEVAPEDEVWSNARLSYLQTLTTYKGTDIVTAEDGTETLDTLTIPEGVQAVDMPHYPYLQVNTVALPASLLYVNTEGVKSVMDDDLLYDRGLMVTDAYTVADGNPRYTAQNGLLFSLDGTQLLGVPTNRTELEVPNGVTKVVLPYQNHLQTLTLQADSVDALPTVNYARLSRTGTILVKDDLLDDYLSAERETLQSTQLHAAAQGNPDSRYTVKDDLAVSDDGMVHLALSDAMRWASLPDYVTGLESGALQGVPEIAALLLPQDGEPITFEDGCFDGADNLTTIGCYSQQQVEAARAAAPAGVTVTLLQADASGYTYLQAEEGVLLLGVPTDLTEFDGTVPAADGPLAVTAIGDGVFRGCADLTWVTLTDSIDAIGYQAFQNCYNLQGVLIGAAPSITIGKLAFDGCNALRFVASNAANGNVQDESLALPSTRYGYGFLYCLNGSTGYNGNWLYFDPDDIQEFKVEDCGGTRVLYGVDSNGDSWLALRAGATAAGTVTLPATTTVIHSFAFEDTRAADDSAFDLNWSDLTLLEALNGGAFRRSELGTDITLPENIYNYGDSVFYGCTKLHSVTLPGEDMHLGSELFQDCTALESATFGSVSSYSGIESNLFGSCGSLQELTFTSYQPPKLVLFDIEAPFGFNDNDWPTQEEEEAHLTIHVPEDTIEEYIDAWRYQAAGYMGVNGMTAYQTMWSYVYTQLTDPDTLAEPTYEEVRAEIDRRLLTAENHIRRLMGLPEEEEVVHKYDYTVDENGIITLTAARGITYTDLTGEELDLPYGWALDCIGANAFAESPDLETVSLPESLVGIQHNAFAGVQIDPDDETDGLMLITAGTGNVPALVLAEEGTPFSFGVPDDRVAVMDLAADGADNDTLIQLWTLPMVGYYTVDDLRSAVTWDLMDDDGNLPTEEEVEAEVTARLLAGENRVRSILFDCETITDPADMVFKENPDEIEDPDEPSTPETAEPADPEGPDDSEPERPDDPIDSGDDGDAEEPDWPDGEPDTFIATPETAAKDSP